MERPLNFLQFTTFYPPYSFGGDAMYVYRLAHALGDAGHHVDIVHCVDSYHLLHPEDPEIAFVVFVEHGGPGGVTGARIVKQMLKVWEEMRVPKMA